MSVKPPKKPTKALSTSSDSALEHGLAATLDEIVRVGGSLG